MLPANASAVLAVPARPAAEHADAKETDPSDAQFAGMLALYAQATPPHQPLPGQKHPVQPEALDPNGGAQPALAAESSTTPGIPGSDPAGGSPSPVPEAAASGGQGLPVQPETSLDQKSPTPVPSGPLPGLPANPIQPQQTSTLPGPTPSADPSKSQGMAQQLLAEAVRSPLEPAGQPNPSAQPSPGDMALSQAVLVALTQSKAAIPSGTETSAPTPGPRAFSQLGAAPVATGTEPAFPGSPVPSRSDLAAPLPANARTALDLLLQASGTPVAQPSPAEPAGTAPEASRTLAAENQLKMQAFLADIHPTQGATAAGQARPSMAVAAPQLSSAFDFGAPAAARPTSSHAPRPEATKPGQPGEPAPANDKPNAAPALSTTRSPATPEAPADPSQALAKVPVPGEALEALAKAAPPPQTSAPAPAGPTPSAPPAELPPPPMTLPVAQVDGSVRWMMKTGNQEAQLQLHPESLGQLTIHLRVEGGEVHARLWIQEPGTVQIIQDGRAHLEQSLKDQGLQLGSFDLHQGHRPYQEPAPAPVFSPVQAPVAVPARQEVPPTPTLTSLNPHRIELYA